jgi:mono/diheme cytochrome c family protein
VSTGPDSGIVIADPRRERLDRRVGGDAARLCVAGIIVALAALALVAAWSPGADPSRHGTPEEAFKYGAIDAARDLDLPYWVWQALPLACPDELSGPGLPRDFGERVAGFLGGSGGPEAGLALSREGYRAMGLIYEEVAPSDLPVGLGQRRALGITRVSLNCAACHLGTVRDGPASRPRLVPGMPAQRFDVGRLVQFLCVCGPKLRQALLIPLVQRLGARLDVLDRAVLYPQALSAFRTRLGAVARIWAPSARQPPWGPGRVDLGGRPGARGGGIRDYPPIWGGEAMGGHGRALPVGIEPLHIGPIEDWIAGLAPPVYPYRIDPVLAARGGQVYGQHCRGCHGPEGGGESPMVEVRTDRDRRTGLVAAWGHAGRALTGVWLTAPYLPNGSVPTLEDLLAPSAERPLRFYRGDDVYDPLRVGFRYDVPAEAGRPFFELDTALPGNGHRGHEGPTFGTELGDADKAALLEYLKTL